MTSAAFLALLSAICFTESGHNPSAINVVDGKGASLGECQVQYRTAVWLGFKGSITQLWLNREVNRKYATLYLQKHLRRYNDVPSAVAAYNAGSARKRNGKFINQKYVDRVLKALQEKR